LFALLIEFNHGDASTSFAPMHNAVNSTVDDSEICTKHSQKTCQAKASDLGKPI